MAILNYTYGTNGIPDHPPSIVNRIDTALMRQDIRLAKSYSPDILIAVMHWGAEYQLDEGAEQRQTAQFLADLGVGLIIGAHPHVIQPVKVVKAKDGRSVYTAYSLGNFISNQKQLNTDLGLLLEVGLEKDLSNGRVTVLEPQWIPLWRYIASENGKSRYYTIPASAVEADTDNALPLNAASRQQLQTVTDRIRARLQKHAGKERKISPQDIL